tara:strand:+ start:408 stop:668 length:261 start_codon:yes stop_codon:yes gene_type:complete
MSKLIFGYDHNGTNIKWHWLDQDKQYWKTWKPKLNDVKIISSGLDAKTHSIIQENIYKDVMDSEFPKKEKLTGMYKVRRKANEKSN